MEEVVDDATEFFQQRENAKNFEGCSPPKLKKRHEVSPLGMCLKEQKDLLRKGNKNRKLDMVAEMRTNNMNEEEKAKYKQMSLRYNHQARCR